MSKSSAGSIAHIAAWPSPGQGLGVRVRGRARDRAGVRMRVRVRVRVRVNPNRGVALTRLVDDAQGEPVLLDGDLCGHHTAFLTVLCRVAHRVAVYVTK